MCVIETERERFWGWGVSLCFFTYLVPSYPKEIGRKMTKYISLSLFYGAMTQHGEGWKLHHVSVRLLRCRSDIYSFTIQTLSTPYYCLSSTFSFIFLLVSVPLLSPCLPSSLLSSLLSFCVHMKGRQGLWQPLKQDRVCVCAGACQAKEQRVICGITSTALNCIKQLTDLFFMTVIWGT